jgi:hypothetical protein
VIIAASVAWLFEHTAMANSLFELAPEHLGRLSALDAVRTFRDLLWARARRRGLPVTAVRISERIEVPDGGVDAEVSAGVLAEDGPDDLLDRGTAFQIKTGDSSPWQPAWVKKELFDRKEPGRKENLGAAVRRCLDQGRRYVLVCFGVDPIPQQLEDACQLFKDQFGACGYDHPVVEVWGQTNLIGLLRPYFSLSLRVAGREDWGLLPHASWALNEDMRPTLHLGPEQQRFIADVQSCLRGSETRHVPVLGESGSGKSRLVLEATRAEDLAPLVVYVPDVDAFRGSPLLAALRHPDNDLTAILVIDPCPPRDRAVIWNALRGHSDRVRLITIDEGPDDAGDALTRAMPVPPLAREQITRIIAGYVPSPVEAYRWTDFCEGSPRVAHVVGLNLRDHSEDLLRPPATVDVWGQFLCGHDDPHSERVVRRRTVLRCVAQFERFGFGRPVQAEAEFIHRRIASAVDPGLTWPLFVGVVRDLQRRGILRGRTTLRLSPRLLQVYLYRDFWETIGPGLNLPALHSEMPGQLRLWLFRMLRYAHTSPAAQEAVRDLLGPDSCVADTVFAGAQPGGELLVALAEAEPQAALGFLQRQLAGRSPEELRYLAGRGRQVVRALERLATWEECFEGAAGLLLALAEAENEEGENEGTSDNARGTFARLFRLHPGMGVVRASPARRLTVLRSALGSPSAKRRRIGVRACREALASQGGPRFLGPEQQGLRRGVEGWWPATHGELWEAYRQVWDLLAGAAAGWAKGDRREAAEVLIDSASGLLRMRGVAPRVLDELDRLAEDPAADRRALVASLARLLRFRRHQLPIEVTERLRRLDTRLRGADFGGRLRRCVSLHVRDDDVDEQGNLSHRSVAEIEALAEQAAAQGELLGPELPWLVMDRTDRSHPFGRQLSRRDPEALWLGPILRAQEAARDQGTALFLGGYLVAQIEQSPAWWESAVLRIAAVSSLRRLFCELVFRSGLTAAVARHMLELAEKHEIDPQQFGLWLLGRSVHDMPPDVVARLLALLVGEGAEEPVALALALCDAYYCHEAASDPLPEEATFSLLAHNALFGDRAPTPDRFNYHWSEVASRFLDLYPHRGLDLLSVALNARGLAARTLLSVCNHAGAVLERIVRASPEEGWRRIAAALGELDSPLSQHLGHWLAGDLGCGDEEEPGPIMLFPPHCLWGWIDEEPDARVRWLVAALPRTLDRSARGSLTRAFVCRYGEREEVALDLLSRFVCTGWCGSESAHFRALRDCGRAWRETEDKPRVAAWIGRYLRRLDEEIERAEVEEEREG